MTYLLILCATLALAIIQVHSRHAVKSEPETVIENKNVNVIVNLDPKHVAEELWKVIETRLMTRSGHVTGSQSAIKALATAVTPLVSPTRRDIQPSIFQVASELDHITRRALTRDTPSMDTLDEEILTRDIVADMMATLKTILSNTVKTSLDEENTFTRRSLYSPVATNNNEQDDDYVNIKVRIHRGDILKALS